MKQLSGSSIASRERRLKKWKKKWKWTAAFLRRRKFWVTSSSLIYVQELRSSRLSTYETKLRDVLMLRKNLTKDEWPVIGHHLKKRKLEGKLSQVFLNKVPLPNCKVQKELRRNKHVLQDEGISLIFPCYPSWFIIDLIATQNRPLQHCHSRLISRLRQLYHHPLIPSRYHKGLVLTPHYLMIQLS